MAIWTQPSGTTLRTLQEQVTTTVDLPVTEGATITLISGELPSGMRLEGTSIVGTPFEVPRETTYRFVLRASLNGDIADRTFNIIVQGEDDPIWITNQGLLPIGANDTLYILDNSPIEFQLQAVDNDTSAGQELSYFIANGDGILPPGIQLTQDGRLIGVVDPILALEKAALDGDGTYDSINFDRFPFDFTNPSGQGFDSFFYDVTRYDIADATRAPKKLNRYYQFRVSVSDGDTIAQRDFRIFVVGDDFLRADNTIMQVGTGTFTADNTNIRTPIWITPANLGVRRSNNYVTLFLDVIDPNSLTGIVIYSLESTNPDDGSVSELPPGLSLDGTSGEVAGRVPYQPRVTETYKFSIKATRQTSGESETAESIKTFTLTLLGEVDSTITWQTPQDLGDISANYVSTLNVIATSSVPDSRIIYTLDSGRLPSGLSLGLDGEIIGKAQQYGDETRLGLTTFDNSTLTFDDSTTSIDRVAKFTIKAQDRFGFSAIQQEFSIKVVDTDKTLYSNLYIQPLLRPEKRSEYRLFVNNPDVFPPRAIYRPNDPNFGIQQNVKMLAYAGIETKQINEFVAKSAKWHKRRKYRLGEVKKAEAKREGTNDVVYEVIYLEVVDPQEPREGKTAKTFSGGRLESLTADNISYEANDDTAGLNDGIPSVKVDGRGTDPVVELDGPDRATIGTRGGTLVQQVDNTDIDITLRDGITEVNVDVQVTDTEPRRGRVPNQNNTIKSDSDAIVLNDANETLFHISNTTNMRESLEQIGKSQREFLPLWMRTGQDNQIQELDYITAIPLAYCKKGEGDTVLLNVQKALEEGEFDFKSINFDVDRYILDSAEGVVQESYIVFPNYEYNV